MTSPIGELALNLALEAVSVPVTGTGMFITVERRQRATME